MSGWPSASTLGGTFTSCGTSERCPGYREPRPEALMTLTRQRRPSWKAPSSSPRRAKSWARSLVIPSIWAASGTEGSDRALLSGSVPARGRWADVPHPNSPVADHLLAGPLQIRGQRW